jgi:unsaturated rhamnogalacturonyl hydrolase
MKQTTPFLLPLLGLALLSETAAAQTATKPYSQRMADAFISWNPDSIVIGNAKVSRWNYEQGLMYTALERVWERTGDARYYTYIQKDLNRFVQKDGSIRTYRADEYQLDHITPGRGLLLLSQVSSVPEQIRQSGAAAAQAARRAAPHQGRRLLAQENLPQPDVARRLVYVGAVLRRVQPRLQPARGV